MNIRNQPINFLLDFSNKTFVFNSLVTEESEVSLSKAKNHFNYFNY